MQWRPIYCQSPRFRPETAGERFIGKKYRRSAGDSCIANEPPENAQWNTPSVCHSGFSLNIHELAKTRHQNKQKHTAHLRIPNSLLLSRITHSRRPNMVDMARCDPLKWLKFGVDPRIPMWMTDQFFTFLNTGRYEFLRCIVIHQGATLQRPYQIQHFIRHSLTMHRPRRSLRCLNGLAYYGRPLSVAWAKSMLYFANVFFFIFFYGCLLRPRLTEVCETFTRGRPWV